MWRRWPCLLLLALVCLLPLGEARAWAAPAPGCAGLSEAAGPAPASPFAPAQGAAERPCHNGRDVVDFAWRLIGYGKATLQYLVGILLLLLGGVFLALGYLIELVEALFC